MTDKTLEYIDYLRLLEVLQTYSSTPFIKDRIADLRPASSLEEIAERQDRSRSSPGDHQMAVLYFSQRRYPRYKGKIFSASDPGGVVFTGGFPTFLALSHFISPLVKACSAFFEKGPQEGAST